MLLDCKWLLTVVNLEVVCMNLAKRLNEISLQFSSIQFHPQKKCTTQMLSSNFTQFGCFDGLAPLNEAVKLKTDSIKSQQNYIKLKTITK